VVLLSSKTGSFRKNPAEADLDNDISTGDILGKSSIEGSNVCTGRTGLQHQDSVRSNGGYSIIDSYADFTSPILAFITDQYPATDAASAETAIPDRPSATVLQRNACSDVGSPASLYPAITGDLSVELLRRQASQLTDATENLSGIQKNLQTFGHAINHDAYLGGC
jgi:hypothetical protein